MRAEKPVVLAPDPCRADEGILIRLVTMPATGAKWIEMNLMPKNTKRRRHEGGPRELVRLLAALPPGRRRVAMALIADDGGPTYPAVAAKLGVHLGTVHEHLRRVRQRHPEVYVAVMKERARQLAARHRLAVARAKAHSKYWHEVTRSRYLRCCGW
jgi:hypothetical protein